MAEPVVVADPALVAKAERVIGEGLSAFNDEVTGINDRQPLPSTSVTAGAGSARCRATRRARAAFT